MKKISLSPLVVFLVATSALTVSATAYAGVTTTGAPKLKEDAPSDRITTLPTSGSTLSATAPDAAKPEARMAARPSIKVLADRRHYSKHCQLEDSAPAVSFYVPMATRWWWTNKAEGDVKFCVVAGAITSAKSAWVLPASYLLSVWSESNSVVPMSAVSGAPNLMVGGAIAPSTTLWAMFPPGARMGSNEFCTSGTVKYKVLSKHQLQLLHPNGSGACSIRFTDAPWVDLRAQVVPKNIPKQTQ